jgi:chromosome segregation ATPase
LKCVSQERQGREEQVQTIEIELAAVQTQQTETRQQIGEQRALVATLEAEYREKQRPERPYSTLGRARHKLGVLERRQARLVKKVPKLEERLSRRKRQLTVCHAQESLLQRRLEQFEADNRANRYPIQADFRLDAGGQERGYDCLEGHNAA